MIKLTSIYNKRFSQSKSVQSLTKLNQYKLLSSNYSTDFKIQINELLHAKTGAKIYHLNNNDNQSTFATIFKTFPSDSKGCPHILEHLACCGSKKYPVRDPFFNMLKRSVNTYMNAWTGQDFTCYPFSSANPKDFNNLFKVYTDMSFSPMLNELDFMQQGWRYEINQSGQKQIKGIVFNQMKGAYQSSQRQLMMALNQGLFGGTGYRHDSGGKPQQIINLSYNQLLNMYKHFYHPSNMSLFFYGNQNIQQNLKALDSQYLSKYDFKNQYQHGRQIRPQLPELKYKTIKSRTAQTNSISLFFYLKNIEQLNIVQTLVFKILHYLMFEKNTSYMYQNFIQTGIAQNLGFSGFNQTKLSTFGITLKGIESELSNQQFYSSIIKLFQKITVEGINEKRMDQFLHELQIGIKTPKQNLGIKILQQSLNHMNHRLELINHLSPLKYIDQAKNILLSKDHLKQFITKYFLNNQHYIVVKQLVDEQGQQALNKQNVPLESSIKFQPEEIKLKQQLLKKRQSEVQDPNILPKLKLEDLVPRKNIQTKLLQNFTKNQRNIKHYHIPIQNQIHFYRFIFNFPSLPFDINDKLSIWNYLINKGISTKKYNYKQLTSKLGQFTAGFYSSTSVGSKDSVNIILSISCLKRNKAQLFNLMQQLLFEPIFQEQNIKNIYRAFQNEAIQTLTDSPIRQCIDQCGSSLNIGSRLFNKYQKIKTGLQQIKDQDLQKLKQINHLLLKSPQITLIQHSNQQSKSLPNFFKRFQTQSVHKSQALLFKPTYISKAVTHNFDVNFCSQQYQGPEFLSKQYAQISIIAQFLEQQYLHPQIREKGGAYGARSNIRQSGNICLYSYMDPFSQKTFQVFDQSVQKLKNLTRLDLQKLEQIKITLIGQLERVKIPQDQGVSEIVRNYSTKQYEQYIQWIKQASPESIIQTARKYLVKDKKSRCVFGKQIPQGFRQQKLSTFI